MARAISDIDVYHVRDEGPKIIYHECTARVYQYLNNAEEAHVNLSVEEDDPAEGDLLVMICAPRPTKYPHLVFDIYALRPTGNIGYLTALIRRRGNSD